mmetsp:Transcript_39046/g.72137  ORF Transcript_39046/g.72137 Transcript_39046/m.72137 type:complete len:337 (-) Transcript_39046:499-1509(-)
MQKCEARRMVSSPPSLLLSNVGIKNKIHSRLYSYFALPRASTQCNIVFSLDISNFLPEYRFRGAVKGIIVLSDVPNGPELVFGNVCEVVPVTDHAVVDPHLFWRLRLRYTNTRSVPRTNASLRDPAVNDDRYQTGGLLQLGKYAHDLVPIPEIHGISSLHTSPFRLKIQRIVTLESWTSSLRPTSVSQLRTIQFPWQYLLPCIQPIVHRLRHSSGLPLPFRRLGAVVPHGQYVRDRLSQHHEPPRRFRAVETLGGVKPAPRIVSPPLLPGSDLGASVVADPSGFGKRRRVFAASCRRRDRADLPPIHLEVMERAVPPSLGDVLVVVRAVRVLKFLP